MGTMPSFYDIPPSKMIALDIDPLPKERTLMKYDDGTMDFNRYQITLIDYENVIKENSKLQIELAKLREENTELKKPKPPIKQPLPPRNAKLWLVHFLILAVSLGLIIYETFLLYMRAHLER